jgi:hypothetical protein
MLRAILVGICVVHREEEHDDDQKEQRTITARSTTGMRRPHQSERHMIHPERRVRAMSLGEL